MSEIFETFEIFQAFEGYLIGGDIFFLVFFGGLVECM